MNNISDQKGGAVRRTRRHHGSPARKCLPGRRDTGRESALLPQKIRFRQLPHQFHPSVEQDHGRIETRRLWAVDAIEWLAEKSLWQGLQSIVRVQAER